MSINVTTQFSAVCDEHGCDWGVSSRAPWRVREQAYDHLTSVHGWQPDGDRDGWADYLSWAPVGAAKRLRAGVRSFQHRGFGAPLLGPFVDGWADFEVSSGGGVWSSRPWSFQGQISADLAHVRNVAAEVGSADTVEVLLEHRDGRWGYRLPGDPPERHRSLQLHGEDPADDSAAAEAALVVMNYGMRKDRSEYRALQRDDDGDIVRQIGGVGYSTFYARQWSRWARLPSHLEDQIASRLRSMIAVTAARAAYRSGSGLVWEECDADQYHDIHGGPVRTGRRGDAWVTLHDDDYGVGSLSGDAALIDALARTGIAS